MTIRLSLTLAALMFGAPAYAQLASDANPLACAEQAINENRRVPECVQEAQLPCLEFEGGSEAGIACYLAAKDDWGALIATRMDEIRAEAPEEIAAIAGIEVKYDLQFGLLQCARAEELTLVRDEKTPLVQHQTARCEATAFGMLYLKLLMQSGALNR